MFKGYVVMVKKIKKWLCRIWHYKLSLLNTFVFVGIVFPFILLVARFARAMCWRLVSDTPYYKIGFIVQAFSNLVMLLSLMFCLLLIWNSARQSFTGKRVLAAFCLLSIFLFWLSAPHNIAPIEDLLNDFSGEIYYSGDISPRGFVSLRNQLESRIFEPKKIVIKSGGGNTFAGLAIGKLTRAYQLDVSVKDLCASSCANYIFPAGKRKSLSEAAIVMYHGNSLQKKNKNHLKALKSVNGDATKLPLVYQFGNRGKEIAFDTKYFTLPIPYLTFEDRDLMEVNKYLGIPEKLSAIQVVPYLEQLEREFYQELGVDLRIGVYGQRGIYQSTYETYKYAGFYYSIEDMEKMGIKNISVTGGNWKPETNADFAEYYKVSLDDNEKN